MEPPKAPGAPSPGKRQRVQADEPLISTPVQLPSQPTLAYGTPVLPYPFASAAVAPPQASTTLAEFLGRKLEQAEARSKQLEESLSAMVAASGKELESLRQEIKKRDARVESPCASKQAPEADEEGSKSQEVEKEDDGLFHFVLATTGQSGSFPRSYFEAAPESLLCKMYSGKSTFLQQDKEGRAMVHCHPDRWQQIIEHLATGAVPRQADVPLLAQARHWKLKRLTTALLALTPGVQVTNQKPKSTTAQCRFVALSQKLHDNEDAKLTFPDPHNDLIQWMVLVSLDGIYLSARSSQDEDLTSKEVRADAKLSILLREKVASFTLDSSFEINDDGWGRRWPILGYSFDQVVSEPLARAQDCLVLEVELKRR